MELLQRDAVLAPYGGNSERLARVDLRSQIGRLERELAGLFAASFGHVAIDCRVPAPAAGPRLLGLGELEAVRDGLAARVSQARRTLAARAELEARNRVLLERMLDDPAALRWVRISRADIGEPGCGHWHSRPRLGLLGMLLGWWQVKVSSGCPSAGRLAAVER